MKNLACKDFGLECDFVAKGETMEALKTDAMAHITSAHPEKVEDMSKMSDADMAAKVKEV